MKQIKLLLLSATALLTSVAAMAIDGGGNDPQPEGQVQVSFKVPSPCAAIKNKMEIADITVDRPYYDIYWTVTCADDPNFFFGGSSGQASAEAGTYTIVAYTPSSESVELNQGLTYTFTFQTSEFGWDAYKTVATFDVVGSGAAAEQFSDIYITDFDGEMGTLGYRYKKKYNVTFSAPVTGVTAFAPLGMDGSGQFPVSASDTENGYVIDVSDMASYDGAFELHIQAKDAATGLRLRGTYELDHSFIYNIHVSSTDTNIPGDDPELPDEELQIASITIDGQVIQLSEKKPIELASYPEGALFTITLADEEIKKVTYEIIDHTQDEVLKSQADLNKGKDGEWTATMPRTYDLADGHLFYVHVKALDGMSSFTSQVLHEYNFLVNGINTEAQDYSPVKLVSVTPSTDEVITDEAPVITLTFSEPIASVNASMVMGQQTSEVIPAAGITTADQISWQIAIPAELINGSISLDVVAIDNNGLRITDAKNGVGLPSNCYMQFTWISTIGLPVPELAENGKTLPVISALNFLYEGIGLNEDNATATWQQIDIARDGNPVSIQITEDMFTLSGDQSVGATVLTLTLKEPLTESGVYTVTLPAFAFLLGHDQYNTYNGNCEYTLTIGKDGNVLHEGENYFEPYKAVTATFTPDKDCKVLIEAEDQYLVTYAGSTYPFSYVPTNTPANVCEIDGVTAGTTITLHSDFVMNPLVRITTFTSGTAIPVQMLSVSPREGTSDFWSNSGLLNISFNKQVTLTGAKLLCCEAENTLDILHVSSAISLNAGPVLNSLLEAGTLKPGDEFQIVINGLCDANDPSNLYNGDGKLALHFVSPEPQYGLISTTVGGQTLTTAGLNSYTFLSYYAPDAEDGLFVLEFESEVASVDNVLLQMGNLDLDAQGKYYEGTLPYTINGNKVMVDARGVLRTLNILFPAVVEIEPEPGETGAQGMGEYDREHITMRVSNVIDKNGNNFRAEQTGNVGSYSFYMNYKELIETINLDGDNKQAGDEVVAGETISLWLSRADVTFEAIHVSYLTEVDEETFEPQTCTVEDYVTEADPYEGIIITFSMPEMPNVAVGQMVRVSLYNAMGSDGPHDLSIDFKAGTPSGIDTISCQPTATAWSLQGTRLKETSLPAGRYMIDSRIVIVK